MNSEPLFEQFHQHQNALWEIASQIGEKDYKQQFHSDLSPIGWHLGHCVFTEIYWIREVLLHQEEESSELKSLFVPELSPKPNRGNALPDYAELCDWAAQRQEDNRSLLKKLIVNKTEHELLQNRFLINFLLQHYAQHTETTLLALLQRAKQNNGSFKANTTLHPVKPSHITKTVSAGEYRIGGCGDKTPYDNEYPCFTTRCDEFRIATRPVCNAEYLAFMQDGGYETDQFWTDAGRAWKTRRSVTCPDHWQQDQHGSWYGHHIDGPYRLDPDAPVYGVNYYEASAYANWAGARLPHEYEWEIASQNELLEATGNAWEWCVNAFHSYPGFAAFPYDGYSMPYFDGNHYTLRGGSSYTRPAIKRHSFRNYYQANKRHIHAGIRLVYSGN